MLAETGCAAVKLEGGEEMAETIAFLVRRGIPVMGHVGLTPQAVNALGGYRSRGHADAERDKIMRDGIAVAEAGAFSLVIEGTAESVARELTQAVAIPTIGIGGSPACDGQILVTDDMLGLFAEFTPKFVKRYRRLGDEIREAAREYADEVRSGRFPAEEHTYRGPRRRQIRDRGAVASFRRVAVPAVRSRRRSAAMSKRRSAGRAHRRQRGTRPPAAPGAIRR